MNLQELKRIANSRTKGGWHLAVPTFDSDDHSVIECGSHNIAVDVEDNDAEFIAMAANNIDAIIARLEKLEKALKFYADEKNWRVQEFVVESVDHTSGVVTLGNFEVGDGVEWCEKVSKDRGLIAKKALEQE